VTRFWAAALLALAPALASAQDHEAVLERALSRHVLPSYGALTAETASLSATASAFCAGEAGRAALDAAYHAAFDAWMGVAHLRFGPSEADSRAFAIAFWPDGRGATARALATLIRDEDPAVDDPAAFADVSVAARGLFALDRLLFDAEAAEIGPPADAYPCRLLVAIARDLAAGAAAIEQDWRADYADLMRAPGPGNPVYTESKETSAELFGALVSGLEATRDLRLGRPLGTFDRPRPRRAEAWRSDRPLRNVELSIAALADLAETAFFPEIGRRRSDEVLAAFARASALAERAPRPIVEAVVDPARRIAVEALATALRDAHAAIDDGIGGPLDLDAGFNALDGD